MKTNAFLLSCTLIILMVIAGCATQQPQQQRMTVSEGATVAIWDLEDLSPSGSPFPDLGELLSARVIQTFKDSNKYTVVERERLLLALEELNIGTNELVDEASRLRLGKMAGAQLMVFGGYIVLDNIMRLDLRLVDVETSIILKTANRITPANNLSAWIEAAASASGNLL